MSKERKVSANLRDVERMRRKIWVLCCWRNQSKDKMVLEFFSHADRSVCLKLGSVFLAGGIQEQGHCYYFLSCLQVCYYFFSKPRSLFQSPAAFPNTSLVPHFHFLVLFRSVCIPLNEHFPQSLCACPHPSCSSSCCFYYVPSFSWHLQVCLGLFSSCFSRLLS